MIHGVPANTVWLGQDSLFTKRLFPFRGEKKKGRRINHCLKAYILSIKFFASLFSFLSFLKIRCSGRLTLLLIRNLILTTKIICFWAVKHVRSNVNKRKKGNPFSSHDRKMKIIIKKGHKLIIIYLDEHLIPWMMSGIWAV